MLSANWMTNMSRWTWLYLLYPCLWIVTQTFFTTYKDDWKKTLRATYCVFTGSLATIVAMSGLYIGADCFHDRVFCTSPTSEFHMHSVLNFMLVTSVYYLQFKGKSQFLFHHFLISLGWYKALASEQFHWFCGVSMLSEFTNTFLSIDFWYFVVERPPDFIYRANLLLLKICYAVFRLILYPIVFIALIHDVLYTEQDFDRVSAGIGFFLGVPIWVLSCFWFFTGVLKKSETDLLKKN